MIFQKMLDGNKIPIIGTGTNTYGKVNQEYTGDINNDTTELDSAIRLGYQLFDTAISYRNESVVGRALSDQREKYFITTKLPMREGYFETESTILNHVKSSLDNLQTDYIDLYLIHKPHMEDEVNLRVYKSLLNAKDKGLIKSVGVSNFSQSQLEYLMDHESSWPVLNQIEINPKNYPKDLIRFCLKHKIIPQAWSPLGNMDQSMKDLLSMIGKNYGKTWAQVWLKFLIMQGINVIPKSHNPQNQMLNLDLFDFDLTETEKSLIVAKL